MSEWVSEEWPDAAVPFTWGAVRKHMIGAWPMVLEENMKVIGRTAAHYRYAEDNIKYVFENCSRC